MSDQSTRPIDIEGAANTSASWQSAASAWSVTTAERRVARTASPASPVGRHHSTTDNDAAGDTLGPQKIETPAPVSVRVRRIDFGKRSLEAIAHWEGVVEKVGAKSFLCRLVPLGANGEPNLSQVEFTEFAFDDLAYDSDRALVEVGAICYWTVGRLQNAAGTRMNVSLVRFRRIPPPSKFQQRRARDEAVKILNYFGDTDTTDATGT